MIDLPGLWSLSPAGFGLGVVAVFYWLLATGRLIPRSSHERELAVSNKRGDEWKETALEYREVNAEIRKQNGELIEGAKTSTHFYRALTPPAYVPYEDTQPGGTYVAS